MSVHILYDPNEGLACMYDSVLMQAYGPVARYGHGGTPPVDLLTGFIAWLEKGNEIITPHTHPDQIARLCQRYIDERNTR